MLTDDQHTIVKHFTSHMPLDVRATYEATVLEMLKHRHEEHRSYIITPNEHEDDEAIQAIRVCIDVMWSMWSQARRERPEMGFPIRKAQTRGRGSSTNLAQTL